MQEPLPKGIIQFPDQDKRDLHAGVKKPLSQLGHTDVNPNEDLSLKNIRDILGKTAVHIVNAPIENDGLAARAETAPGSNVVSFVKERKNKLEKVA